MATKATIEMMDHFNIWRTVHTAGGTAAWVAIREALSDQLGRVGTQRFPGPGATGEFLAYHGFNTANASGILPTGSSSNANMLALPLIISVDPLMQAKVPTQGGFFQLLGVPLVSNQDILDAGVAAGYPNYSPGGILESVITDYEEVYQTGTNPTIRHTVSVRDSRVDFDYSVTTQSLNAATNSRMGRLERNSTPPFNVPAYRYIGCDGALGTGDNDKFERIITGTFIRPLYNALAGSASFTLSKMVVPFQINGVSFDWGDVFRDATFNVDNVWYVHQGLYQTIVRQIP